MRRILLCSLFTMAMANLTIGQQIAHFKDHTIEADLPGGYAVVVADINHDGKPDVIGSSGRQPKLIWYENPTWEPHVIATMEAQVNLALHDVDGDGIPEIAIQNGFAMQQAKSPGLVWLLAHDGDPKKPWKSYKIDAFPTSHHVAWIDVDGDGKKEIINAPLVGKTNVEPTYVGDTPLFFYRVPKDWNSAWKRETITENYGGIIHRVRVAPGKGKREQVLIVGFEGLTSFSATGKGDNLKWERKVLLAGHNTEPAPRLGLSDYMEGRRGKDRMIGTVEPWHGNEVVAYNTDGKGGWQRQVLFDKLIEGHEVCVGDFNGDGRSDIVAGDRAKGKVSTSHVFFASEQVDKWHHEELDSMGMSASGCQVADLNGDGKLDIIMTGGATHNIKWYENLGTKSTVSQAAR